MQTPLIVFAVICLSASCTNNSNNPIRVSGEAKMKVVPDVVELSLKASAIKPSMKDAVMETQMAVSQILAVCHRYIKDESDIKVSSIATDKAYDYDGRRQVFKGYSARQVLEVRLKDIRQIEKFTEDLLATKINSIDNIRYDHSRADSIQRVVNLMALTDARKTAEKMCDQMQVHLGKTIFLSNYPPGGERISGNYSSDNNYDLQVYSKSFGGRGFKMTPEILEFRDIAFADFEIEQ